MRILCSLGEREATGITGVTGKCALLLLHKSATLQSGTADFCSQPQNKSEVADCPPLDGKPLYADDFPSLNLN